MSFYQTSQDLRSRLSSQLLVSTEQNLPYNFLSTPFFGAPQFDSEVGIWKFKDPSDYTLSYQVGDSLVALSWNELAQSIIDQTPEAGTAKALTPTQLAGYWQEFFYVFQPFLTQELYSQVSQPVEDHACYDINPEYYNELFKKCFTSWRRYCLTHSQTPQSQSFIAYLNSEEVSPDTSSVVPDDVKRSFDMSFRSRNVILWQLARVINMISKLNTRATQAAARESIWLQSAEMATRNMAAIKIEPLQPSSEDVRVPDPDSLEIQNGQMVQIETERANNKRSEQRSALEDATVSYAADTVAQQRASLNSFWSTLSSLMNSLHT